MHQPPQVIRVELSRWQHRACDHSVICAPVRVLLALKLSDMIKFTNVFVFILQGCDERLRLTTVRIVIDRRVVWRATTEDRATR